MTQAALDAGAEMFVAAMSARNVLHLSENLRYVREGSDALKALNRALDVALRRCGESSAAPPAAKHPAP